MVGVRFFATLAPNKTGKKAIQGLKANWNQQRHRKNNKLHGKLRLEHENPLAEAGNEEICIQTAFVISARLAGKLALLASVALAFMSVVSYPD